MQGATLIEPDWRIARIRLSDKTSRLHPRRATTKLTPAEVDAFNHNLEFLADYDPDTEGANGLVSQVTALEFARLGTLIDPDEVIGLGIYGRDRSRLKWRRISYAKTAEMRAQLEAPVPAYASVQGIIHSLQKEVRRPFFRVRELATDALVSCFYPMRLYGDVVDALRERTTVLHVAGDTVFDRATRAIAELRVDRIEKARMLSNEEFEQFFGSAPDFTGDLSTDDYIDEIREEDGR